MSTRSSQFSDSSIKFSEVAHIPQVAGQPQAQVKTHGTAHAINRTGDGGLWDTVSNVNVLVDTVDGLPGGKNI